MPSANGQSLVANWRLQFAATSLNRRIFSAAVLVGGLTLVVKLASMCKDMVVAASFGTSSALDCFFIALLLPAGIINIVASCFSSALIPVYIETRQKQGAEAAQLLLSNTVVFSSAILLAATLLLGIFGHLILPLVSPGFNPEQRLLTERLFYLLLPAIAISGLATNWEAVLNAGERFGLASLAPILLPLATIAALYAAEARVKIYALAIGTVAGMCLQMCVLGAAVRRRGVCLMPSWRKRSPALRRVINQYLPLVGAGCLVNGNIMVDQAMASTLAPGSVSALNYGNKIVALILTIGTMALGTAVLPYFSQMVAAADWKTVRHTLRTYIGLILVVTLPLTVLVILLSKPLVALLFERGNFTPDSVREVASIQSMYMLQLPFYTLVILFVRMISSLKANQILAWGTVISFILNVSLDYLLMKLMGIKGIALSTSCVYLANCLFLAAMLHRKLKEVSAPAELCV